MARAGMVAIMGVTTTLERMHALVLLCEAALIAENKSKDFQDGVFALAAELYEHLDVGDLDDQGDLWDDAQDFCLRTCAYGKEGEPGEHMMCRVCALKKHTLGILADEADAATAEATNERRTR
jgi:hypothetical protein